MLFLSYYCYAFVHVCFFDVLWSPAGKGLTSWLWFVMSNCEGITFPLVSWDRVVLDCIDSRSLLFSYLRYTFQPLS